MSSFNLSGATGRVFNLKKITKKLFLITHGTLKPVKFTATSSDVIIEDDILCDGDNCYQLIIEDVTIKLDPINEIENVLSEAKADNRMGNNYKTTDEDNDEHDAGSDFVKDVGNTTVGFDLVDDVKNDKTFEVSSSDASLEQCNICMDTTTSQKTKPCRHTFFTDCIDQQFKYKTQCPTCEQFCGTEQHIAGKEYAGGDRKQHKDSDDDRNAQRPLKASSIYLNVNSKQTKLLNNDLKDNNSPTTEPASPVKNKTLDVLTTSRAKYSDKVNPILYEVAATEVKFNLKKANQTTVKQVDKTLASEIQAKEENDWKDRTQKRQQSSKDRKEQYVLKALTDRFYVIQCGLLEFPFDASSTNVKIRNDYLIDGKNVYKLMIEDEEIHIVPFSKTKNVSPVQTPAKHTTNSNISYAKSSHVADRPIKISSNDDIFLDDLTSVVKKISIIEEVPQEKAETKHQKAKTSAQAGSDLKAHIENKAGKKQTEAQNITKIEDQPYGKPLPAPRKFESISLPTRKNELPTQKMDRGLDCNNDNGSPKDLLSNKEEMHKEMEIGIIQVNDVYQYNCMEDVLEKCRSLGYNPKVVHIEGNTEGLLIFQNYEDALKCCEKVEGGRYCLLERMTVYNFSQPLNCETWKSLGSENEAELINELKAVGVTVVGKTDKKKINAPTTYQLEVAQQMIEQFCNEIANACIIKDVPSLVWRTASVIHRNIIDELRKKCNTEIVFSEEESEVRFPWSLKSDVNELTKKINYLKDCQIEDIAVTEKELSEVENTCKNVERMFSNMGGCIFDKAEKIVFIYGEYDEFIKLKFQWELNIGRKRATGRGYSKAAKVVFRNNAKESEFDDSDSKVKHTYLEPKLFDTNVGIKIIIYKGRILDSDVECIVNAANSSLDHGGGLSKVIADAAGVALESDGKAYLKKYGKLSDGSVCSTSAGHLKYKYVIHAVGPRWPDYTRRHDGSKKCKETLLRAVKNAFLEADRLCVTSIALPAISSAFFEVPLDICVRQYVLAVEEYCELRDGSYEGTLREIHFIDGKSDVVRAIQDAFSRYFTRDSRSKTNIRPAVSKPPEPLMYEKGLNAHVFMFSGHDEYDGLLLCKENIENITDTNAVVVPVNEHGEGGHINDIIQRRVEYKHEFSREKQTSFKGNVIGDVIKVLGYGCGFTFVMYVVYPRGEKSKSRNDRKNSLRSAIENLLRTAEESSKVHSLAVPMFGIDSKNADDVELFSSVFIEQYKTFCEKKFKQNNEKRLTVKVICPTDEMYYSARKTFVDYVKQIKDEYTKEKLGIVMDKMMNTPKE